MRFRKRAFRVLFGKARGDGPDISEYDHRAVGVRAVHEQLRLRGMALFEPAGEAVFETQKDFGAPALKVSVRVFR